MSRYVIIVACLLSGFGGKHHEGVLDELDITSTFKDLTTTTTTTILPFREAGNIKGEIDSDLTDVSLSNEKYDLEFRRNEKSHGFNPG